MTSWYIEWDNDVDISLNSFIDRELNNTKAPRSYNRFFKNLKQEIGNITTRVNDLSEDILKANAERDNYREYYITLQKSYNDLTELYKKEHCLRMEKEVALLEAWKQVGEQKELVKNEEEKVEKLTTEIEQLKKELEEATKNNNDNRSSNDNNDKNVAVNVNDSDNNIITNNNENHNSNQFEMNSSNNDNKNNNNNNNNNGIVRNQHEERNDIPNLRTAIMQLSNQFNELKKENNRLRDTYQQSLKTNEMLSHQSKSLEAQLLQTAQQRQSLEGQLIDQLKTINHLRNQVSTSEELHAQSSAIISQFQKINQELHNYKMIFASIWKLPEGVNLLRKMYTNPELLQPMRNLFQLHYSQNISPQQSMINNNASHMNNGPTISFLPQNSNNSNSSNNSNNSNNSTTNSNQNYRHQ